jgi:hypothetical protein
VKSVAQLGFRSAIVAFVSAALFDVVQAMQVVGVLRFPWDAILIYAFSLGIAPPLLLAMVALHHSVAPEKRIWSHAALLFATMYVACVSLNYVVQLSTVIPATLRGAHAEVALLDQTPHSLFWDLDALGYIWLGVATAVAAPVFGTRRIDRWARRFFLANAAMTPVIAFVYFRPTFSLTGLLVALPWAFTAPGSILCLALFFRSRGRASSGLSA